MSVFLFQQQIKAVQIFQLKHLTMILFYPYVVRSHVAGICSWGEQA